MLSWNDGVGGTCVSTYDVEVAVPSPTSPEKKKSNLDRVVSAAVTTIVPESRKGEFIDQYNCRPPPIFISVMVLIEVIAFIVYAEELKDTDDPVTADSGLPLYSPFIYKPTRRYEAWRFLTYLMVHQGWVHLVGNLLYQLLFGIPLELVHKWWRVLIIYFCGTIAGSLAHSIVDHPTNLAGASGGTYALMGAHIASVIINWDDMNKDMCKGIWRFLAGGPFRLGIVLLIGGVDTGVAIYKRFAGEGNKIGIASHIGSFLAGLLLGTVVLENFRELKWETILKWITLTVFICLFIVALFFNIFYDGYPATDWSSCCT